MRLASLIALLLVAGSGVAFAEGPGVEGEVEQATTTTPEEKAAYATKALEEIDGAVSTVEKLRDQAKKAGQKEAVDCLERKLKPLQALAELGRGSTSAMQRSLQEKDDVHAEAEFRKLAVSLAKSREFLQDAQQCVVSPDTLKGKTTATVASNQENLIDVDDVDEGAIIEPPMPSPY